MRHLEGEILPQSSAGKMKNRYEQEEMSHKGQCCDARDPGKRVPQHLLSHQSLVPY